MDKYFSEVSDEVKSKAGRIRLLVTDVDGVLTDGGIIYDDNKLEYKKFNVKDGFIVAQIRKRGIMVGAITGRHSRVVENRCEELGFDFHYHGIRDKSRKLKEVLDVLEIQTNEVAYIGDDLLDLPLLRTVGLSSCPSDAVPYLKPHVDYISIAKGGEGVFREVADLILESKGLLAPLIEKYMK